MSTAIELLKAYGTTPLPGMPSVEHLIGAWMADKEYTPETVRHLANGEKFGSLLDRYVLGVSGSTSTERQAVLNYVGRIALPRLDNALDRYTGSPLQNHLVDHAVSEAKRASETRFRDGSCNSYKTQTKMSDISTKARETPIAVIGAGAAGILISNALLNVGFTKIAMYEKGKPLGIWANPNVAEGSRNNPLTLTFRDSILDAAPGDGRHVVDFLKNNFASSSLVTKEIDHVEPGVSFDHKVFVRGATSDDASSIPYPIVINCIGLGKPKPLSDKNRMTTTVSTTQGGERWQRKLTAKECRGKRFMFIGLGNSTAEMLRQVHELQDQGVDMDYRIMTHFSKDAIHNPETEVTSGGRKYRVFRDISVPNLTSWQGDLLLSRYDYFRALRTGKIIPGVRSWSRVNNGINYQQQAGQFRSYSISVDQLFALIGYGHHPDELHKKWAMIPGFGGPRLDYDGEIQRTGTTARVWKGYYAFGAVGAAAGNLNAIVIPGMLFRMHDMIAGVIMRALEYHLASEN